MKNFLDEISPSFIKNKDGQKIGVFLNIEDYNLILDQLEDFCLGRIAKKVKSKKEKTVSIEQLEKDIN